ncbi:MAG: glutathione peroxidase [Bacteroidota bacterium]|nr:glutathione peroxidase [Bacteroidota bacterium]MDX5430519.1 glutathione peroxidase [Bacteroidota bacterium]MDX5469272.1 glutathione peroxidase [Bacteroidota bacterium]
MKKVLTLGLLIGGAMVSYQCAEPASTTTTENNQVVMNHSFHDLSIKTLDGSGTINFADFKGKKVLCVNTASECGYTYQYEGLEELHQKYKDQLVLIGFPCNQFGGQEPGAPEEIADFCKKNFGVTFLLTEKIDVKGDNQHPVYQWLTQKEHNGVDDYTVKWNFNKFLIDEEGNLIGYFESGVKPMDEKITSHLK